MLLETVLQILLRHSNFERLLHVVRLLSVSLNANMVTLHKML